MTVRDVLVQIGFLMVTAGAMLAAWAIFTGQFGRGAPEPDQASDEPVEEPVVVERPAPARRQRTRTSSPKKKPAPRKRRPSA